MTKSKEKHCDKCSWMSEEGDKEYLVISGCAYCGCHESIENNCECKCQDCDNQSHCGNTKCGYIPQNKESVRDAKKEFLKWYWGEDGRDKSDEEIYDYFLSRTIPRIEVIEMIKEIKKGYSGAQYRYGKEALQDLLTLIKNHE